MQSSAGTHYTYLLHTITARSMMPALTQFISIFGIPQVMQLDQGSNVSHH